ncbi:MAG TPA: GAF domain-containing sensor histidine kinase [Chloroflexota bacterium]
MIRASDIAAPLPLASADSRNSTDMRLEGQRLLLVRFAWLAMAVLVAAVVLATLPERYAAFRHTAGGGLSPGVYAAYEIGLFALAFALFEVVAALLVWHRSAARMALLSALALGTFPVYATPQGRIAHVAPPLNWAGAFLAFSGVAALTLSIYLVPDGRFTPRWTRWLILPWALILGGHQFLASTSWDYTTWPLLLSFPAVASGLGPAIAVMLYRYRRVLTSIQRRQTEWLVWGVVLACGIVLGTEVVVRVLLPSALQQNLLVRAAADTVRVGAALLVPVALALAIARHRLWAIDLFIHRTLVYGMLTASVILLYVLVVGTLSTLLSGHAVALVSLIATGLVAVLFQPLRERLQHSVNRLLYGERDDPYHLLSRLGQQLEETLAPDAVLPAIVETVARALKLPYVAIALPRDGESVIAASHGTSTSTSLVLPLVYRQEVVGHLLVAPRAGSDALSPADRGLVTDLTRQVAVAVHATELTAKAVRLSADLQHANSRLITLREEERRRLRRDLHDGLGPALASVTLQAENARDLLRSDPAQADAVLADLTRQAQTAIADIRRVVYDLRPPALDDLGLIDSIRAHAGRLSGQDLCIRLESNDELPPLPAAVEVAAYRLIQEAMTNVVRHAEARTCTVSIRLGELSQGLALLVDVTDDGRGMPGSWQPGVGLQSMHTRAAELCGRCVVESPAGKGRGTRVSAVLPLRCPDSAESMQGPG